MLPEEFWAIIGKITIGVLGYWVGWKWFKSVLNYWREKGYWKAKGEKNATKRTK